MKRRLAFTLVELIVVIVVLAILSGVTIVGYKTVTDRAADSKMVSRTASILKEAQVLFLQKNPTDSSYSWNQAVADATDNLPTYFNGAWSDGVNADSLNNGANGWTVTEDTGVAVFSNAPNDLVVYTKNDTVYIASAVSSDDVTRAVYGYVSRTGAPRVWIARCGGSSCDAQTPTSGAPVSGAYPVGTRVPSAPGNTQSVSVALVAGSYTDVAVSFSSPDDDGGAAIDSFRGTCTSSNGGTTRTGTNTVSPVNVTGLTGGKDYTCSAAAHNSVGWGAETVVATTMSIVAPPDAPSITGVAGGVAALAVSFTLGASDGGSPVTSVEYSLGAGSWTALSGTTSPQMISGLTSGSTYSVRIRSKNAAQPSAASAAVSGSAYTVPGASAISSISGVDKTLVVSFTAPGSNGGSAITSYEYSLDSGAWTAFSGTTSPQTLSGLGIQSYSVRVRAINVAGAGSASSAATGVANGPPPTPGSFSATAASSSQINVTWTYTDPGDLASFTLKRSDGATVTSGIAEGSRSASVTGLSQNTSYSYYVVAVDDAGNNSAASATGTATTSNAAPPMSTISWQDGGAAADSTFNHRVCWTSDSTQDVHHYSVVINGAVTENLYRWVPWSGAVMCSAWVTHAYNNGINNSWYVQAVDDNNATSNSNTLRVIEGYKASAVMGWVQTNVPVLQASVSLTINACSDANQLYRDPYYNKVGYAFWDATIARGGSPYYDLTSGTRAMQRRTSGGYAGWGPVGTGAANFYQNRGEDYQASSANWSGYWGSRATPGVSPCYWNATYPTKFVTTIGYDTRAYQETSAAWTVNPVYT